MVIALSSDIDWAPNGSVEYYLNILDKYDTKITIFATHKIDGRSHEIALHPNTLGGKTYSDAINELLQIFPHAKGSRMHGLQVWSRLLLDLPKFGITYDSSYYLPDQKIKPYRIFQNLVEIPIFWEDDLAMMKNSLKIDKQSLKEQEKSEFLYLYNVHPLHVFMNTSDLESYYDWKPYYHEIDQLKIRKNKERYGTEDALIDILDTVDASKLVSLSTIASSINQ